MFSIVKSSTMVSWGSALLTTAVVLSAALSPASAKHLVKDPPEDSIMVSNHTRGLWINCMLNGTDGVEVDESEATVTDKDGEVKDLSKAEQVGRQIKWSHRKPGESASTPIDAKHVTVKEDGKSVLHVPDEEEAAELVGEIVCEHRSQEQEWEVRPHFKLEKMPKSDTVVEGEDLKIFCKLRK